MDLKNPKGFQIMVVPKFGMNDDDQLKSAFKWGVLNNPRMIIEEGKTISICLDEDQKDMSSEMVQMMRLFACNIVKDLIRGEGIVDQRIVHKINFLNERPDIKKFLADSLDALEGVILDEILYQIDPLKPTKSRLETLSLNPKQDNIQNNNE